MSIESVMPSNHLILCRPLLLLPSIFPSIRVFSNESALRIRWPKYRSFSFSISPSNLMTSNEHQGLTSFRIDWLALFAVQGALKSLFQHHSSKASTLWRSAFFTVQLLHPYRTTGKTIALTRPTFVGKVMSLLFNMLSRLEKAMATHSSTLAWQIPWTEEPGRLYAVHGVARSWTELSDFTFLHWRRTWQPPPVFLPGESQGWGSLVGCHLWGFTELDTTEAT